MLNFSELYIVDFETEGIKDRPDYPPNPVGVSIRTNRRGHYYAWGHPTENNCTKREAQKALKYAWRYPVVFHNAQFDIAVAMEKMNMPMPKEFHDTLFLAYLFDPRDETLSLKPWTEKYLNMDPHQRDTLKEWILENVPNAHDKKGRTISDPENYWAANICKAPGKLTGKYANSDTHRTDRMFRFLYPKIVEMGMLEAYIREISLLPSVIRMEKQGIRVDTKRLKKDVPVWEKKKKSAEVCIQKRLGKKFDVGSSKQLSEAMDDAGMVSEWIMTDKGNRSTSRDNLLKVCKDKKLIELLSLRGVLSTYTSTFGLPWIEKAEKGDGYLYPSFHQVRSSDEWGRGGGSGTRSGRFSSSNPNFQNVPRNPHKKDKSWTLQLPLLRSYVIPDEGCSLLRRDYSQQELRILAHFEEGELMRRYLSNPWLDIHDEIGSVIRMKTGVKFDRYAIKIINFSVIYGKGIRAMAEELNMSVRDTRDLKKTYLKSLPGIGKLTDKLYELAEIGMPLRTWGGRLYYCEEPKIIQGVLRTFEYKMLNYAIQPSAADCTKQGMVNLDEMWGDNCEARMTIQVHDELLANCPIGKEKKYMKDMTESMEDVKFDVPMLTEGKMGSKNWSSMKEFEVLPDHIKHLKEKIKHLKEKNR